MRRWLILGAVLSVGWLGGNAQTRSSQANKYSVAFDAVWKAVQENFYDPAFLGVDWGAVGQRYRPRASQVQNDDAFVLLIRDMLRQLPTSHLGFRTSVPTSARIGIGVLLTKIDGKDVVSDVWFASDAMRQGLRRGDIILSGQSSFYGQWGGVARVRVAACDGKQRTLSVRREEYGWPFERFSPMAGPETLANCEDRVYACPALRR